MIPSLPSPHLVVRQACFALGALQTFLDPMFRLDLNTRANSANGVGTGALDPGLSRHREPRPTAKRQPAAPRPTRPRVATALADVGRVHCKGATALPSRG